MLNSEEVDVLKNQTLGLLEDFYNSDIKWYESYDEDIREIKLNKIIEYGSNGK